MVSTVAVYQESAMLMQLGCSQEGMQKGVGEIWLHLEYHTLECLCDLAQIVPFPR